MFYIKKKMLVLIVLLLTVIIAAVVIVSTPKSQETEYAMAVDDNVQQELSTRIRQIIGIRNRAMLEEAPEVIETLYDTSTSYGEWAYLHEIKQLEYLHQWEQKQGATFQSINSEIVVRRIRQKESGGYLLDLLVNTEFIYSYDDEPEVMNSFRQGTYHSLDLLQKGNMWVITREWYTGTLESSLNMNNITEQTKQTIINGASRDFSDLSAKRQAALKYIDRYCGAAGLPEYGFQYNINYYNYNNRGGDCANFASQMLYEAGEFKMEKAWKYSGNSGLCSWVSSQKFKNYILSSGRGMLIASGTYQEVLEQSYQLQPGDIIAYGTTSLIEHISIVSGADSKGYILVNCHNADRYRTPWDLGWSSGIAKFWLIKINY